MNMKENILFLRNERATTGEVDKTGRTELGKCIHLYDVTQGNKETQENCFRQMQEKWTIIKAEGSKEEDRQEEADVKKLVKNGHADLKRRHQNANIRKNLSGQIVANTELQNKQDLPTVFGPCLSYNPHYGCFFAIRIARLPK